LIFQKLTIEIKLIVTSHNKTYCSGSQTVIVNHLDTLGSTFTLHHSISNNGCYNHWKS